MSLKSPGIKPKRQNNTSTLNSRTSHWTGSSSLSTSTTGELSPTTSVSSYQTHHLHQAHHHHSQSSAQEYSVFANVQLQSGPNSSMSSSSQMSSSLNLSNIDGNSIPGSTLHLSQPLAHTQPLPPELPLRSLSNNSSAVLSPSALNLKHSPLISPKVGIASTPGYHHQHHVSADMIDFQAFCGVLTSSPQKTSSGASATAEEAQPPLVLRSPPNISAREGEALPSPVFPTSFDFVAPISPHVNVPPKLILGQGGRFVQATQHQVMPPPLPPRVRRRDSSAAAAQHRQAPDAPQLPPRDISPPPLPPRTQGSTGGDGDVLLRSTGLMLPNTSTIMMRRNSAAAAQAALQQTGAGNGQGLTGSQSSFQLGQPSQDAAQSNVQVMNSTRVR